jgi:hypothetical protein
MLLKGITQKGKNRVRELGADWTLIREADGVLFSTERGPWALVKPTNGSEEKCRWINLKHDTDFEIVAR